MSMSCTCNNWLQVLGGSFFLGGVLAVFCNYYFVIIIYVDDDDDGIVVPLVSKYYPLLK